MSIPDRTFFWLRWIFRLPDDVWLVDLDSNKLISGYEIPPLPEPEGTILKNHLKQVCTQHLARFPPLLLFQKVTDASFRFTTFRTPDRLTLSPILSLTFFQLFLPPSPFPVSLLYYRYFFYDCIYGSLSFACTSGNATHGPGWLWSKYSVIIAYLLTKLHFTLWARMLIECGWVFFHISEFRACRSDEAHENKVEFR